MASVGMKLPAELEQIDVCKICPPPNDDNDKNDDDDDNAMYDDDDETQNCRSTTSAMENSV